MPRKACTAIVWLALNISCIQGALTSPADVSPLEEQVASAGAVDPGPRGAPLGAGGPLPGLSSDEVKFFAAARAKFQEVQSVSGSVAGEDSTGLGPVFNANSCASCHAEPALGGTSPHPRLGFLKTPNPEIAFAALDRIAGRAQAVPSFILPDGPIREVRFVSNSDGTADGSVHGLYTIAGRIDAPGCSLAQPDFAAELAKRNVIFRIPTPLFGAGLLENVPDKALVDNLKSTAGARRLLRVGGRFNRSGNDGTITRFGWKAQNKSLLIFAGEAYSVEQGVTSEFFPNKRVESPGCDLNPTPEDSTNIHNPNHPASLVGTANEMVSDVVNFAVFMRLLAPPVPATASPSELKGAQLFASIGCALCHSPSLTTAASPFTGQGAALIHPFSDLALHHMGPLLADHVSQGAAGPDEFRTAPLWGVGQRIFFLHDGRAGPGNGGLLAAILAHRSKNPDCDAAQPATSDGVACRSEANGVIDNFRALRSAEKQDLLYFLRSL
jgi:CxxC motif-containing protein (DUF1111 family)